MGRVEPYLIEKVKVSIDADNKKDFGVLALPVLIRRFRPKGWYVPKTAIRQALSQTRRA
jgi:hypothetical protein